MIYKAEINGLAVEAYYSEESIQEIFIPLLQRLTKMYEEKKKRILVMVAAPPGTGKSTLVHFLQHLSEETEGVMPVSTIGMDGFHHYQEYINSHTMIRDGKEYLMKEFKGAPETFDFVSLKNHVQKVLEEDDCGWPEYSRIVHDPIDNAITVQGKIIFLEGIYLLLNWEGWKELSEYADYTIKIVADEDLLRGRLVARKAQPPITWEEAEAFVERSDLYNTRTILRDSKDADLVLQLQPDHSYKCVGGNSLH